MVTRQRNDEWALLLHRLPREPSAPRIALWRALRRLGAVLLGDGLVGLPASSRTIEHLEWLAAGIVEQGGSASVWVARPTARVVGEQLEEHAREAIDAEYRAVIGEAESAVGRSEPEARRILRRLRREARRIASRDFFGSPVAAQTRDALDRLARATVEVPG